MGDDAATGRRNLGTLDGIRAYVVGELREALSRSVEANGFVPPLGVVIASRLPNGEPLDPPQLAVFGGFGERGCRVVVDLVRMKARQLGAPGAILTRQDPGTKALEVLLEHREHGNRVWRGIVTAGMVGPLTEREASATELARLLPERWAN